MLAFQFTTDEGAVRCFELGLTNLFMLIIVAILLVTLLRLTYLKRKQEILLREQMIILINLTKKAMDSNTYTHKQSQQLVGGLPKRLQKAVEKAVLDSEARRSDSDLPRQKPLSQDGRSHE